MNTPERNLITSHREPKREVKCKDDDEDMDENARIFPQRLMEILADDSNADSIAWLPHGKAFVIKNRNKFAEDVLPKYFRRTKFSSFTRKLNRWNFSRVTRGSELGAYYNEFFLRDKPHLAAQMFCKNARSKLALSLDQDEQAKKVAPVPASLLPYGGSNLYKSASALRTLNPTASNQTRLLAATLDPSLQAKLLVAKSVGLGGVRDILDSAFMTLDCKASNSRASPGAIQRPIFNGSGNGCNGSSSGTTPSLYSTLSSPASVNMRFSPYMTATVSPTQSSSHQQPIPRNFSSAA